MPADPVLATDQVVRWTNKNIDRTFGGLVINTGSVIVLSTPATPVDKLSDLCTALDSRFVASMLPRLSEATEHTGTRVDLVTSMGIPPLPNKPGPILGASWEVFPTPSVGGMVKPEMPSYVTVSFRLVTGYAGRNWRSGLRVGLVSQSDHEPLFPNEITAARITLFKTAIDAWLADLTLPGLTVVRFGLLSPGYAWDFSLPTPKDSFAPYVAKVVSKYFRSQVSRKAPHVP